jgi:hypothetical protein
MPVDLKHTLILREVFRFKPANHLSEHYQRVASSALNTEDLISNSVTLST